MSRIGRWYLWAIRLIGLANITYDQKRQRLNLHHKPAIAYCFVLNALYVALLPLAASTLLHKFRKCDAVDLHVLISTAELVVNLCTVYITVFGLWFRRRHIYAVASGFARVFRKYRTEQRTHPGASRHERGACQHLLPIKCVSSLSRFVVLLIYFYGDSQSTDCDDRQLLTWDYVLWTLFICVLEILMIFVDLTIFIGLLLGNALLEMLLQHSHAVRYEVNLLGRLPPRCRCRCTVRHEVHCNRWLWVAALARNVRLICRRQRQLKSLVHHLIAIVRLSLLGQLLCSLLDMTAMFFSILEYVASSEDIHTSSLLGYLLIASANFLNLLLFFYLCECIQQRFVRLREIAYKTWLYAPPKTQLDMELEFLSLELQQNRCRLDIFGFLQLNMNTALRITKTITLYLMLFIQLAIQES